MDTADRNTSVEGEEVTQQPDWSLINTQGPPDDVETNQHVKVEESESLFPDASLETFGLQDVKP